MSHVERSEFDRNYAETTESKKNENKILYGFLVLISIGAFERNVKAIDNTYENFVGTWKGTTTLEVEGDKLRMNSVLFVLNDNTGTFQERDDAPNSILDINYIIANKKLIFDLASNDFPCFAELNNKNDSLILNCKGKINNQPVSLKGVLSR